MKNQPLPMAWNEPGNQNNPDHDRRPPNKPQSSGPPDLDEVFDKLKNLFNRRPSSHGNTPNTTGLGFIPAIVGLGALLLWGASGLYIVEEGRQGIELVFGRYHKTTNPGLNWRFPNPIGTHQVIDIQKRFSQKIGTTNQNESHMLTSDEAIVDIRLEVQYQIIDAKKYWFNINNPDATLKQVIESAIRERVGQSNLDTILTSGRAQLMTEVKVLSQTILDRYGSGLLISNLNLENAQPPNPVQPAFSDAIRAREDEQSRRNQADAYERQIVLRAEGEAARDLRNAEAQRDRAIAEAKGEAERFNQLYLAYKQAPFVTRQRLYLETMETVLTASSKIFVDQQTNPLMVLPMDQLLKQMPNVIPINDTLNPSTAPSVSQQNNETAPQSSTTPRMRTR